MSCWSPQQSQPGVRSGALRDFQLTVLEGVKLRVFRLPANDERVVTVGATQSADILFDQPDISPIHFYFERLGNDVWIVPAYCVSGLRVNDVTVTTPQRLPPRARVEFGRVALDVELAGTTDFESSTQSGVHSDVRGYSSDDDAPTRQAWAANETVDTPLTRSIVTVMVPRQELVATLARMRRSGTFSSAPPGDDASSDQLADTVQISSILPVPQECAARQSSSLVAVRTPFAAAVENVELPSLTKTLYGVSPSSFSTDLARLAEPSPERCIPRAQAPRGTDFTGIAAPRSLRCVTQVPVPPFANRKRRRKRGMLLQLGQLARQHPLLISATVVLGALLAACLVIMAANAIVHSRDEVRPEQYTR